MRSFAPIDSMAQQRARNPDDLLLYPITKREREVLVFLSKCADIGIVPSYADISNRLKVHRSRAVQLVAALHRKGWLTASAPGALHCMHVQD